MKNRAQELNDEIEMLWCEIPNTYNDVVQKLIAYEIELHDIEMNK